MSDVSEEASVSSSPADTRFGTHDAGADQIHDAQLQQLRVKLGELDEMFPGFGAELQASFPDLPADEALLGRSTRRIG
jgi:hypothetical protein